MFNLRYIFRLTVAFFSRFKALILIGICAGVFFFFLLRFLLPFLMQSGAYRIGLTGRYTVSNLPPSILNMVGNGLTKLDVHYNVEPNLSSSWETPDKGKTWIFTLKNNLFWQDGKKVTASTITYQFSDVTIERPDEKTILFKLQNSYSAFPAVVSRPVFRSGLLGTGEWKVTKLLMNGSIVESITLSKKDGSKIIYKFYPTEEGLKLAFELGEVDEIDGVFDAKPLDAWSKLKISKGVNTGEYVAIFFNTQDKNLSEKNLRQALSYAINKNSLGGTRAISPISMDSWAYNPQVKPYDYDPIKARQMVDDYKKNLKIDQLTLTLSTSPILLPQAEKIAKDWEEIGVKTDLRVVSSIPTDYQTFLVIFDIPDDPDQYSIWHSTQTATNISHYQNPRIDKLLEDGRSQINLEDRRKTYLDFQRFLVEDSPAAFLYYPTNYTIKRK
jgi:peptide/nickel transport system substrate-binding protein